MSSEESHAPDASFSSSLFSGWQWPALATAWVFGAYLRIWEMGSQVVMGDETHTLISAGDHGPWAIMADHGMPDVCIPLALWTDLLLNTIGGVHTPARAGSGRSRSRAAASRSPHSSRWDSSSRPRSFSPAVGVPTSWPA